MNARLIDGIGIRTKILHQIKQELARRARIRDGVPGLAVIRVGYDPASSAYIRQKKLTAQELGYDYREHLLAEAALQSEVMELIGQLNRNSKVHGILLDLPIPPHLSRETLVGAINPDKDVDGLHPVNAGMLFQGRHGFRPCTPLAVMRLLEEIGFDPAGKKAVIIGRSNIVGKPIAMLLLAAHATATICHRQSDLPAALKHADLVVAAVGVPRSIKGTWIKRGAAVIDVGINRVDGTLVGDVEFEEASKRASFITPVPGGVGAVTVAMLMHNTFLAWASQAQDSSEPESDGLYETGLRVGAVPPPREPAYGLPGFGLCS
ncbi:MAG: folD [Proteobacteria bacterium]|nr:folD [Pseudomonadota bacterium]